MRRIILFFNISILTVLFTGCVVTNNSLTDQQKYDIYHAVAKEINNYKKQGDVYYKNKYFYNAIKSYEKVNFYEGRDVYSKKFINQIKRRAKANGEYFYKKALAFKSKNKIKSFYYINIVMRNDPTLKKAIELKERLYEDKAVRAFLNKKEADVDILLSKETNSIKSILILENTLNKLTRYDDQNKSAIEARNRIDKQYSILLNQAISFYNEKYYSRAKRDFTLLNKIYEKDQTINSYLENIKLKEKVDKAKTYLSNEKYNEALEVAKMVLKIDKDNKEAKEIIKTSTTAKCYRINILEKEGIKFYIKQKFDEAKDTFEKIVICDPKNHKAIAYLKKINHQLNTLKKLR